MSLPSVFGFYGGSNTGKTKLIVKLIERLSEEGYNVATIKTTDKKISIDREGKDTWRHSQAGSPLVVFSSPCETDFIVKDYMETEEICKHIADLGSYDIVLVEGARDPDIPKINMGNANERENTIGYYHDNFDEIIAIVKKELHKEKKKEETRIIINGKKIPLTEFPAEIIKNTMIGMLKSLKGVEEIDEVEIRFKT